MFGTNLAEPCLKGFPCGLVFYMPQKTFFFGYLQWVLFILKQVVTVSIKDELKKKFERGSTPSQVDFEGLIDFSANAAYLDAGELSSARLPQDLVVNTISADGSALVNLNAANLVGELPSDLVSDLDASKITSGKIANERLPNDISVNSLRGDGSGLTQLTASTLQGVLNQALIPDLDGSKIASGEIDSNRLPQHISVTSVSANGAEITHLNPSNIAGILPENIIPNLDASKIVSGKLDNNRLPSNILADSFSGNGAALTDISADHISSGQLSSDYLHIASETQIGITRFANLSETQQADVSDKAISPKQLSFMLGKASQKVDEQLGLIKAGLKFRDDVCVVATYSVDKNSAIEIDGYELNDGDRVLLTQQADPLENTVWIVNPYLPWEVAEDLDNDIEGELAIGISVEVTKGDEYAKTFWSVSAINNGITWKKRTDLSDYSFGSGINISGLAVSIDDEYVSRLTELTLGDGLIKNGASLNIDPVWLDARIKSIIDNTLDETLKMAVAAPEKEIDLDLTFTNAGATGRQGPSQSQIDGEYAGTDLLSRVAVLGQGIQKWTVPKSGKYLITAQGAQGCVNGSQGNIPSSELGRGAKMTGCFMLSEGQILWILVGQMGEGIVGTYGHGGGGGGSFVSTGTGIDQANSTALIVAGGGGAIGNADKNHLAQGQIITSGASGYAQNSAEDSNNNLGGVSGGAGGGGGKGFSDADDIGMDAASGWSGSGASSQSFLTGGLGSLATKGGNGGFGGGGALMSNEGCATAAGGGGYSGGGASDSTNGWTFSGGGGGSINTGTDQLNEVGGADEGHGKVIIKLSL